MKTGSRQEAVGSRNATCHPERAKRVEGSQLCAQNDRIGLREVAEFLLANDHYCILTHRRPDGDTIGSAAALCRALRALGKTAWIYENPQFTPKFAPFLEGLTQKPSPRGEGAPVRAPGRMRCPDDGQPLISLAALDSFPPGGSPTVISVDVASRTLFPFGMVDASVALAIDHHGSNDRFADRLCVDPDAAACGEIIWSLLGLLGVQPAKEIAEAVYVAVSTDTGCFRYSNVTATTLRVAADCVACGAQIYPINQAMFETRRWPRLKLESYLVQTAEFYHGGLVAICAIPNAILDAYGLTEDDIDDISAFARNIEGVRIGVTIREVEGGKGKLSVRTAPGCSASDICARLGGGGHPAAAGATVEGGIDAAKAAVLEAIEQELKVES